MIKDLSSNQYWLLGYLSDLNDEYDERDYSKYGDAAELIRAADLAFMNKVGAAFSADRPLWGRHG